MKNSCLQDVGHRPTDSLVVVGYTVDVTVLVHGEGDSVQSLGADHTAETAGVVGVSHSL